MTAPNVIGGCFYRCLAHRWLSPLQCHRSGFSAANAQSRDTARFALLLHGMGEGNNQTTAGGADGVALGTGATEDIDFFVRQVQCLHGLSLIHI